MIIIIIIIIIYLFFFIEKEQVSFRPVYLKYECAKKSILK